ncbi:MAG: hypothetical protein PUB66_02075 [Oscillospiraceae bacterium]|nr:hypothetical protein [Oscillospiraceae bacterium]
MNNNYSQCEKCGSRFINYENQLVPIHYSCFGTFCLILLLFVPIVDIFILVHLITRKHVDNHTIAVCTDCGYKKNITPQCSKEYKKDGRKTTITVIVIIAVIYLIMAFVITYFMGFLK